MSLVWLCHGLNRPPSVPVEDTPLNHLQWLLQGLRRGVRKWVKGLIFNWAPFEFGKILLPLHPIGLSWHYFLTKKLILGCIKFIFQTYWSLCTHSNTLEMVESWKVHFSSEKKLDFFPLQFITFSYILPTFQQLNSYLPPRFLDQACI